VRECVLRHAALLSKRTNVSPDDDPKIHRSNGRGAPCLWNRL
jgi:hypothetical protein